MATQEYSSETHNTYIIVGNSALFKCEIPSYVTDFVAVVGWEDNDQKEFFAGMTSSYGKLCLICLTPAYAKMDQFISVTIQPIKIISPMVFKQCE